MTTSGATMITVNASYRRSAAQTAARRNDFWALMTLAGHAVHIDHVVQQTISDAIARIGRLEGRRVAEIGSGSGRCAAAIKAHRPAELLAVEQSATLVEMSRELHPDVEVVNDDYANLAAFGSFDVVFALAHVLFIHDGIAELLTDLRNIRAAMPDFGCLIVEQFQLSTQPREYGSSDEVLVREETEALDPTRLRHAFTVSSGPENMLQQTLSSLVLDRDQFDTLVREAAFLVSDEWEHEAPTGEISRMYLLRAQKGFNYLSDLPQFLESWLSPAHPRNNAARSIILDEHGRARPEGILSWGQGASLSRHHAEFCDSLEPAIRPLVLELVDGWNFVTYSSCDGHAHTEVPKVQYSESYCGIIAFSEHHEQAVARLLEYSSAQWCSDDVRPTVRRRPLLGPTAPHRGVDLLLTRVDPGVSWQRYQSERDRLIEHLCDRLRDQRSADDA